MTETTTPAQIDVAQLDAQHCFINVITANEFSDDPGKYNIPWDARIVLPELPIAEGMAARFDDAAQAYTLVEDHRRDALYYETKPATGQTAAEFAQYQIGIAITMPGTDQAFIYDGLGMIPNWLTATAPAAPVVAP